MKVTDPETQAYVQEKTRRIVGHAALRQISEHVSSMQAEDERNALIGRIVVWVVFVPVVCLFVYGLVRLFSGKGGLFLVSMLGAIVLALAPTALKRRRNIRR